MAWRLAISLETLRSQINEAYPNRSKASDGTIGDTAHQAVPSDHNPNSEGVVCALDLTHDPSNGFNAHDLADHLRLHRHPQLKYIISYRRIADESTDWNWTRYDGDNPHDKHIHISVGKGPDGRSAPGTYDSNQPWDIGGNMPTVFNPDGSAATQAEYDDARDWKERGLAAEPYKRAVQASKAWGEANQNIDNIKPALDDLVQFKKDTLKLPTGDAQKLLIEFQQVIDKYKR